MHSRFVYKILSLLANINIFININHNSYKILVPCPFRTVRFRTYYTVWSLTVRSWTFNKLSTPASTIVWHGWSVLTVSERSNQVGSGRVRTVDSGQVYWIGVNHTGTNCIWPPSIWIEGVWARWVLAEIQVVSPWWWASSDRDEFCLVGLECPVRELSIQQTSRNGWSGNRRSGNGRVGERYVNGSENGLWTGLRTVWEQVWERSGNGRVWEQTGQTKS